MSMLNMLLGIGEKPNLVWSGNALTSTLSGGLVNSGNTYKWRSYNSAPDSFGSIQSVNSDGIFSGNSITPYLDGIIVSGNLLRPTTGYDYAGYTFATYNIGTKTFTGKGSAISSLNENIVEFQTSGGLMRISWASDVTYYSPYISLT